MHNAIEFDEVNSLVYVTGYLDNGSTENYFLYQLTSSGSLNWGYQYDGPANANDRAEAIALDLNQNPVITGHSNQSGWDNTDYYTTKLDQSGNVIWGINYNGLANNDDNAWEIVVDGMNDTYVIGQSEDSSDTNSTWITVKYVEHELYNVPDDDTIPSNFYVEPNWGQLSNTDTIHSTNTSVQYYSYGSDIFFENDALVHGFYKIDPDTVAPSDTIVRVDMNLTNDPSARVYAINKESFYSNYYLPQLTATKGLEMVPSYEKAVYPGVYKDIDMMVSANFNGVKEQFVISPAGNANDIGFWYDGADTVYIDTTGKLHIETVLGNIIYQRPIVSQIDSNGNYISLGWQPIFKFDGDTIIFDSIQSHNIYLPLVIEMNQGDDPLPSRSLSNPVWCTHYGSDMLDDNVGIDSDNSGNLYVTGHAANLTFPHTTSIITGGGGGGGEIFMAKFSPYGVPVWRLLWGGQGGEIGRCTKYDAAHNVVFCGGFTEDFSGSSTNLYLQPQPGAYNHSPTGLATYGCIGKFNASFGFLQWASLFGEDDNSAFTDILSMDVNATGDLLIGGNTTNMGTFPMVANTSGSCGGSPYQTALTNKSTGFVAVFDNVNDILWSTPFGSDLSVITDVRFDEQDRIYLTGYVDDGDAANFPLQHEFLGDYSVGHSGGDYDAFMSKIEFDCWELKWSTMFGGNGDDSGWTVSPRFSLAGVVYFAGSTNSTSSFPIVSNANINSINNSSNGGGKDGFIARFRDNFLSWSTYVGDTGDDMILDSEIGDFDILYLLGSTESSSYVNVNYSGAYNQPSLEQTSDATITALDIVAGHTNLWSTYFGGTSTDSQDGDVGSQLTTSPNILYISGKSRSNSNFPWNADLGTYPSAYYQPYRMGGVQQDLFLAQIDLLQTPIGIEEQPEAGDFIVYPNPTSDLVYLRFDPSLLFNEPIAVEVMDMQGRVVFNARFQPISNGPIQINLVSLVNGFYVVRANTSSWSASKKLIISH